ncbi:flagellar motor switch phosphatase FliY [Pelotomaculum terephthalicicum JT]|uniref:flagellar motor switch phosphatase FliY n=1 Tax=Pelotomaculum TaxID=191373 RepID=UPI0009CF343A|nr:MULTISPECIES: flagellar motor switch phosphatase FliY [Pelotomaculum]MCG9967954.1 flagellar motor switch phosphatase FliY [Pelotomaculum terephthalicicum JT]OPX88554.1 MAG: Flagellar motor switch protein FliN [Pelotomaculum sp. PtaB.Bin117]OPY63073.1 MAG: Flagellar motor switch protein FliN [Pelotomaculum sp. PtaU1.Bin065]
MMSDGLLKQEEIDALLGGSDVETEQVEMLSEDIQEEKPDIEEPVTEASALIDLTDEEKDALGEVGNICMGAASTTLSMLLNQKVNITSPQVSITTIEDLFASFTVPYMTIYIQYIEGLSGFNLLMMRLDDAAVLADLMMGGDGTNTSEELNDIGISAASEAMNQMIGSSSTSMASMFGRTVNISPPETIVYRQVEGMIPLQTEVGGPVVVVSFKMTIGEILDTRIMQVMGVETAREEAGFILGNLYEEAGREQDIQDVKEENPVEEAAEEILDSAGISELTDDLLSGMPEGLLKPEPPKPVTGAKTTPAQRMPAKTFASTTLAAPPGVDQKRLDMILDIPVKVTALLGRTKWPIKDILGITPGSVVELENLVDEPVEILVNGILVAMGEVVVVNENFGVRITSIIGQEERLQKLMQRKIP